MRGFLPVFLTLGLLLSGCTSDPKDEDVTSVSATTTTSATNTTTNATAPVNHVPVIGNFSANATGLSVVFLIKATDADNQTLTYALSSGNATLGNGTVVKGQANATYNFTAAGVHNVTLVVSDGKLSANRTLGLNLTGNGTVNTATQAFTASWLVGTGGCAIVVLAPGGEGDGVIGDAVEIDPAIRGQKFIITFEETPDSIGYDMFWLNDGGRDDGTDGPTIQGIVPADATGASFRSCGGQGTSATFTAGPDVY